MVIAKTMTIELLGEVSIYLGIGIEVFVAMILGGIVGYDREKKLKAAGLKTNILICLGATLYTCIGILVATSYGGNADPNRIAAQIVSGIGFLGAGAIMQSRGSVFGMTTAATIWVMAAIGFAIGSGYPFSAAAFSLTVLIVLKMINPIYKIMERQLDTQYHQLEVLSRGSVERTVMGIVLNEEGVEVEEVFEEAMEGKKGFMVLTVFLHAHYRQMERIAYETKSALKVEKVVHHLVSERVSQQLKVYSSTKKLG